MHVELFILSLAICKVLSQCAPKNVKFVNFQKTPKRSAPCTVKVTAEKCPGLNDFYYKWELKDGDTSKVIKTSTKAFIKFHGYDYRTEGIFDRDYYLTVFVSHYPNLSYNGSTSDNFRFRATRMHIEIKGGKEKSHQVGKDLKVDAKSLSKDLSYLPNEDAFINDNITWTINPKISGFSPSDSLILIVPARFLKLDQKYKFTVQVFRRKISSLVDFQTASQVVTIVSFGPPELEIECVRNCKKTHPKEQTTVRVVCKNNCKDGLRYKWNLNPPVGGDKTDLGDGYDSLVIKPEAYKEGDEVTVTVKSGSASAKYDLEFMEKMEKGECEITPRSGVSGVTVFKIKCTGFDSNNDGLKYLIYQKTGEGSEVLVDVSKSSECRVVLSEGTEVEVRVQDSTYLQEEVKLSVNVSPFRPDEKETLLESIKEKVLIDLQKEKSTNKIIQMVSLLLDAMENAKIVPDEVKRDLNMHMAGSILNIHPDDFTTATQILSILSKLQKCKLPTDTYTSRLIGKSLNIASKAVHDVVARHIRADDSPVPALLQEEFTKNFLPLASKLTQENPDIEKTLEKETPAHDYDSYDEMISPKINIRHNLRDLTDSLLISLQILFTALQHKTEPDEQPKTFNNDFINSVIRRIALKTLRRNQTIQIPENPDTKVFIPETLIEELQKKNSYLDYQFGVVKKNPFWWHVNNSKINTEILLFDFFDHCRKIKTTENPFIVYQKTKNVPAGKITGNTIDNKIIAHRVRVEPGFSLVVVFVAAGGSYKATASDCYCRKSDFDSGIEVKKGGNKSERTLKVQPGDGKKFVYVCVLKPGDSVKYEGDLAVFSCTYWDLKTGKWSSNGCSVKEATLQNDSVLVCECTHASFFAGQLLVPPNTINFNFDLDFHIVLLRNWAVLAIVIGMIVMWGLILLAAAFVDRNHNKKNFICKLNDNVPGDRHVYLLVVSTGFFIDAGTTADVAFQLMGERGCSRIHVIKCTGVKLLQQSSQDWFVIYTPVFLGKLIRIRLWHNCKGSKPHWYCSRIVVQHLKSGVQYFFSVEKWFSLVWGTGKIYHEIAPKNMHYLKSRKLLFGYNVQNQFADGHLWVSVFTRDAQSNFNSLERAGAAACTFFLSMLASAMFYGIPKNGPQDSIDPNSAYFITFHDLAVFFESWLVAVPVGIAVTLLFRNSASNAYITTFEEDFVEKKAKIKKASKFHKSTKIHQRHPPERP